MFGIYFPWFLASWDLVWWGGARVEDSVGDCFDAWDGLIAGYEVDEGGEGGWVGWRRWLVGR